MLHQVTHRCKEPESCVVGVVFSSLARIWKAIRQHPLIVVGGKLQQNILRNRILARSQDQTGQGDHCVATPVTKPVIAGDDGLLLTSRDYKLVCSGS